MDPKTFTIGDFMLVTDPCYTPDLGQAGFFDLATYPEDPHNDDKFYSAACAVTDDKAGTMPPGVTAGFVSSSGYGDGSYDLTVGYDAEGRAVRVEIVFIGEDYEDTGVEQYWDDVEEESPDDPSASRPLHLTWDGGEWVDDRCGCRYHPDDDSDSHGGAPHVHRCERHSGGGVAAIESLDRQQGDPATLEPHPMAGTELNHYDTEPGPALPEDRELPPGFERTSSGCEGG